MNCREAREVLSHEFPSPLDSPAAEAQQHVRHCGKCRSYLRSDIELRRLLAKLESEKPSAAFKEQLFDALSKARWQKSLRRRKSLFHKISTACLLSLLFLLLALGWGWWPRKPATDLVNYLIEDHQQNLPGRLIMSSSSPREIEKWFEGKVDFPMRVRVPEGAEILGARLCRVEDQRAALVFYRCRSRVISWFTFPVKEPSRQHAPQTFSSQGYNLVIWKDRGLTHAIVSDLDGDELRRMLLPAERP